METNLTSQELVSLIRRVFNPGRSDQKLGIMVDMPDQHTPDQPAWKTRREMAATWASLLREKANECNLQAMDLLLFRNARANNADLPSEAYICNSANLPATADELTGDPIPFNTVFDQYQILMAPTQFSATAPLKMAAKTHSFRAATMGGFDRTMIPALRLDYSIVERKVNAFKQLLDYAQACAIQFDAEGTNHHLRLDLRHRSAHASGGIFNRSGTAGNLPSGEAYIVPYEGEVSGDPSLSEGEIPVQFGDDVVVYRIEENRAVKVISNNPASTTEANRLRSEPAYGNLAELGLGVLGEFGLEPTGAVLLDEKLGVHIAFGRSDHFGGQVGPSDFSAAEKVIHIDRVYIPKIQPKIIIRKAILEYKNKASTTLMVDGDYQVEV